MRSLRRRMRIPEKINDLLIYAVFIGKVFFTVSPEYEENYHVWRNA